MVNRVSALEGHDTDCRFGINDAIAVHVREIPNLVLFQAAAWVDSMSAVESAIARSAGTNFAPGPVTAATGTNGSLLRIEPMKWWLYGITAPELPEETGVTLDLSHSRTHVRISGPQATTLLNRNLPLDLSEQHFPVNSVASSSLHHVGVTLWRSVDGYELFIPRGFAVSVWEVLMQSAAQFDV